MHPIADPWFYAAAIPAVIFVGLSKGGFGGTIAMLGVPIMALVVSPLQAAGIMLPILIVMDIVALLAYKGKADWKSISILLPAAFLGIAIGWTAAAVVSDAFVTLLIGVISIGFVVDYVFRGGRDSQPANHNVTKGAFWGSVAGFTSFISHTGGPPFQMYMLPLRLPPVLFVGTAVIFFASVNFVKLVPYYFLGQFDPTNLATSVALFPVALLATLAGVRLVKIVKAETFYKIIYVFMALIGVKLVYDGMIAFIA